MCGYADASHVLSAGALPASLGTVTAVAIVTPAALWAW